MDEKTSGISHENQVPARPHSALLTYIANGDFQTRQAIKQRAAGDAQLSRSSGAITTVLVQAIDQEHPLYPLQALA